MRGRDEAVGGKGAPAGATLADAERGRPAALALGGRLTDAAAALARRGNPRLHAPKKTLPVGRAAQRSWIRAAGGWAARGWALRFFTRLASSGESGDGMCGRRRGAADLVAADLVAVIPCHARRNGARAGVLACACAPRGGNMHRARSQAGEACYTPCWWACRGAWVGSARPRKEGNSRSRAGGGRGERHKRHGRTGHQKDLVHGPDRTVEGRQECGAWCVAGRRTP